MTRRPVALIALLLFATTSVSLAICEVDCAKMPVAQADKALPAPSNSNELSAGLTSPASPQGHHAHHADAAPAADPEQDHSHGQDNSPQQSPPSCFDLGHPESTIRVNDRRISDAGKLIAIVPVQQQIAFTPETAFALEHSPPPLGHKLKPFGASPLRI